MPVDLAAALQSYCELKRQACADAAGPADVPLILELYGADERVAVAMLDSIDQVPGGVRALRQALGAAPAALLLLAEVYVREQAPEEAEPRRGDLSRALHEGDFSVEERLLAVHFSSSGEAVAGLWALSRYSDTGQPLLSEPESAGELITGGLLGAVAQGLRT